MSFLQNWALALCALVSSLLWCHSALAAPPVVVIVTEQPNSSRVIRLRAELEVLGVRVRTLEVDPKKDVERTSLEQMARDAGAFAALRTTPSANGVEVWIADRATGKTLIREFVTPDATGGAGTSDEQVAVGTVELLRTSLMELRAPATSHKRKAKPAAELETLAYPTTPQAAPGSARASAWVLALGSGVDAGIDALGPALHGQLVLWWAAYRESFHFGPCAWAATQLIGSETGTSSGEVQLHTMAMGLGGRLQTIDGPWRPSLSAGGSLVVVTARGLPAAGFIGAEQHELLFAPFAEAGVSFQAWESLSLRLWTRALLPTRRLVLEVADEHLAAWGRPAWLSGIEVEIWMP